MSLIYINYVHDAPYIHSILFRGLENAFKIATAESYDGRRKLLDPPSAEHVFGGVEDLCPRYPHPLTRTDLESRNIKALAEDPDTGPVDACTWAFQRVINIILSLRDGGRGSGNEGM